ncbi:MAG: shikimate dehydrogenase [Clostridia bacterium]|nr:shikimate dehydrogenase [Clostridia bacterium]MBQ9774373.1 shikimate dehydrogenase [Clostridia bacterium]
MKYGCIGEHLKHSFSAEIHHALSSNPYVIREVAREALDEFMTARDFLGINVTIPYKEDVIPHLGWMSEQAKSIGAVNTIVNRDGKLFGYNTDFLGMSDLIRRVGVSLQGRRVAVLGTGGTSRTACAVAQAMGAREILRVSRREGEGVITYGVLTERHTDIDVIINTTPCGMYPNPNATPVELGVFPRLSGVIDAIYNPLRPQLILDAKRRGIPAEGGLYMLVAQAVRASEIFLDCTYDEQTTARVYQTILRQKENIVLIGMPASGKSTVGRTLATQLGRDFFDLDEEIVRVAGCPISDIFAKQGEEAFRELEARVLREQLAQRNGIVLATGGGAILREDNLDQLRRNGRLYFLDRPLSLLLPTDDRPLAKDADMIRRRYEERYDRYCACADVRVDGAGTVEAVAEAIRKDFETI